MIVSLCLSSSCATNNKVRRAYFKVTVQKTDTLVALANQFDTSWKKIIKDNRLKDGNSIKVGQVLKIYPGPKGWPTEAISPKSIKPNTKGLIYSNVKKSSFIWPVIGRLSSRFGMRRGRPHHGIDIRANRGTPIKASESGIVSFVGWKSGYGRTVIINHPHLGKSTLYAHCLKLHAKVGDRVPMGKKIATVGNSGRSTGYHLHFEIRGSNRVARDPLSYLNRDENRRLAKLSK